MRIMHLLNHCGKANGHVNVSVDLAITQRSMGYDVGYTCASGDFIPLLESAGVKVYRVEQPHRGIGKFFSANVQLNRAIRDFAPDVLHVHMAAQSVLVQPYRLLGYKVVTTLHNEFDRSAWLMGRASRVVTVGQTGFEIMRKSRVPTRKLRQVQNGSVGSPRLPAAFTPADLAHPAILTVCGMHPRKGVGDLLNAFALLRSTNPDAHLYLAGEGPTLQDYKAQAEKLGIAEHTHFLGFCNDPRRYLFAADIFVLASHADPGPLVIAEARHAGIAIVASDVDGIPAMLDHGNAGLLIPPKQPEILASTLRDLLDDPPKLAEYRARSKRGAERFTIERVCLDMEKIYRELI